MKRLGLTLALLAPIVIVACGDLKVADGDPPVNAVDGAAPTPAADASKEDPGVYGPGPHGSLPSGYCCNADSECRYRRCVDTGNGGSKMCLDECFQQAFCTRPDIQFTCSTPDAGGRGLCQPSAGFACIPANTFKRGASPIGACCNAGDPASADGTTAAHCEGNQCASVASAPLVCVHRCEFAKDCPGGFQCVTFGTSKACVPTTSNYTCN